MSDVMFYANIYAKTCNTMISSH